MPKFLRTLPERGFRRRARAVAVLFCAVCLGLAVRLFFLQVRTDGFYADRAQGQQLRDTVVPADRGRIYSADGLLLAANSSCWTLRASPREMPEEKITLAAHGLAEILALNEAALLEKFSDRRSNDCLLRYRVDRAAADAVRDFCEENSITGIRINQDSKRWYPQGAFLASVLGFTNVDNAGVAGLELKYDDLLTGENGTGKDMLAREIHALSARRDESLVSVDMGALTETLFESELFGHVKGAFTDARSDRAGKFEVASGGTLFLDEIGNLPYHLQSKLLSVIQSRTVTRVGSNTPVPVDIRLICATNRNLPEMVASGSFREDLFYRINTIHVTLPPLRDRPEDILPLAERFLSQYAARYGKNITAIDRTAAEKLGAYPWYGNIRELQHAVEKAVILCEGERLQAADFVLAQRDETVMPGGVTTLEEMESSLIRRAMDQHKGNLSQVAVQLGITRQTLYNKIKKYNL